MSEKTKAQKLYEKCKKLAENYEKEESLAKRILYGTKLKMAIAKLDREIDLDNIKQKFEKEKEGRDANLSESKKDKRKNISELTKRIKSLKRELKSNSEYDYKSEKFMYPKSDVNSMGGINNYIDELRKSKDPDLIETADKIEKASSLREKIEGLEEDLAKEKDDLRYADKRAKVEDKKAKMQETAMVVRKKANIFSRVGDFFKSAYQNMREAREEKRELKQTEKTKDILIKSINTSVKDYKKNKKQDYQEKMAESQAEYERKMAELKRQHEQEMAELTQNYKEDIKSYNESNERLTNYYEEKTEQDKADIVQSRRQGKAKEFMDDLEVSARKGNLLTKETANQENPEATIENPEATTEKGGEEIG